MERIKAVRGNKQRVKDVFNWLKEQGGSPSWSSHDDYSDESKLFFVVEGSVFTASLGNLKSKLVEIVPLPRWRANVNEDYYYISSGMRVLSATDINEPLDDRRWEIGNYFQTSDEADEYANNIVNMLMSRF